MQDKTNTLQPYSRVEKLGRPMLDEEGCVSIVGMAAAGKSTMGRELAKLLGWALVDTDNVIEAIYGTRLQNVANAMSKDEFLDLEGRIVRHLNLKRCIISTGGSVPYRPEAMRHLGSLGPIIYIDVPLPVILERIARKPDRGLAIAPGQTIEDLFNERRLLYEAAADITVSGGEAPAITYVEQAAEILRAGFI